RWVHRRDAAEPVALRTMEPRGAVAVQRQEGANRSMDDHGISLYLACDPYPTTRPLERSPMASPPPICRTTTVFGFGGDRSRRYASLFLTALADEKNGVGPRPTTEMCLLYTGHAGLSTDGGSAIYGFNPDGSGIPVWQLVSGLRNGEAFPGVVTDDTAVFIAARRPRLPVLSFQGGLPGPRVHGFLNTLFSQGPS